MKHLNTTLLFTSIIALSACGSDAQTGLSDNSGVNTISPSIAIEDIESSGLFPTIKNSAILNKSLRKSAKRSIGEQVYNKNLTVKKKRWRGGCIRRASFYGKDFTTVITPSLGDPDLYAYAKNQNNQYRRLEYSVNGGLKKDSLTITSAKLKPSEKGCFFIYGYTDASFNFSIYKSSLRYSVLNIPVESLNEYSDIQLKQFSIYQKFIAPHFLAISQMYTSSIDVESTRLKLATDAVKVMDDLEVLQDLYNANYISLSSEIVIDNIDNEYTKAIAKTGKRVFDTALSCKRANRSKTQVLECVKNATRPFVDLGLAINATYSVYKLNQIYKDLNAVLIAQQLILDAIRSAKTPLINAQLLKITKNSISSSLVDDGNYNKNLALKLSRDWYKLIVDFY